MIFWEIWTLSKLNGHMIPAPGTQLKSINIHVKASGEAEAEFDNPLLYKVTLYITTGLIEVQGNEFEQFYTESFPVLRDCVKKMIEDGHFLKSRVSVLHDSEDIFVKWVDPVENPNPTARFDSY